MTTPDAPAIRFLPAREAPIERATDLGSVQVLKHGNLYLLTEAGLDTPVNITYLQGRGSATP